MFSKVAILFCSLCFALSAFASDFSKLVILHTNDTHGFDDYQEKVKCSLSVASALKQDLKKSGFEVILLDAGDSSQDHMLVNFSKGKSAFLMFNLASFDAMTLGNHEFDYGQEVLFENIKVANFPVLGANIFKEGTNEPLFKAHTILNRGDYKIGIFGLTTAETPISTTPVNVKGLSFLKDEALYKLAKSEVEYLKEQGCNLIIALVHLGAEAKNTGFRSYDLIFKVPGIDIVIDGHDHEVRNLKIDKTLLVETGSHFNHIGKITYQNGSFVEELIDKNDCYKLRKDEVVDDFIQAELLKIDEKLNEQIGFSQIFLDATDEPGVRTQETAIGNLICDAILWQANEVLKDNIIKADAAIVNGGNIRSSIAIGSISAKQIKQMLPFDNQMYVTKISGRKLLEILEASSSQLPLSAGAFAQVAKIEYTVNPNIEYEKAKQYQNSQFYAPKNLGSRVSISKVGNREFKLDDYYNIVVSEFMLQGGDSYAALTLKEGKVLDIPLGFIASDALINYIKFKLRGVVSSEYQKVGSRIKILKKEQ